MGVGKTMFVFYFLAYSVFGQDCGTEGEKCGDTKQCCGGCCRNGICTDAIMEDCVLVEDICESNYCPPGYDCQIYKPPDCKGCEIQRLCVTSQEK